jgi:hypothetical protein
LIFKEFIFLILKKKKIIKNMSQDKSSEIIECLPKQGFLFEEDTPASVICKPKLMPLKSVTLEKV